MAINNLIPLVITKNPLFFSNLENPSESVTLIPNWLLQSLASPRHVPSPHLRLARQVKSSKLARNIAVARNIGNIARIIRNIRNLSEKVELPKEELTAKKPFFRVYSK